MHWTTWLPAVVCFTLLLRKRNMKRRSLGFSEDFAAGSGRVLAFVLFQVFHVRLLSWRKWEQKVFCLCHSLLGVALLLGVVAMGDLWQFWKAYSQSWTGLQWSSVSHTDWFCNSPSAVGQVMRIETKTWHLASNFKGSWCEQCGTGWICSQCFGIGLQEHLYGLEFPSHQAQYVMLRWTILLYSSPEVINGWITDWFPICQDEGRFLALWRQQVACYA